ncbi:condensation domain-containing protein, partial [Bacillus altitudinis]|uniref:condensation domain-containing protein n=1 Tax=Bacillus altitudinis TaxID=293387 RepID=UPI003B518B9C
MLPFFINLIPTPIQLTDQITFRSLLSQTHHHSLPPQPHQYIPIYHIQANLPHQHLIHHILLFHNLPPPNK